MAQLALVNATAPSFVPNTETDGLCPFINAYLNTVEDLENVFLGFTNAIQSFLDGIVDGLNNPAVQLMKGKHMTSFMRSCRIMKLTLNT